MSNSTLNDWEDEIKDMLCDAGLKPIHFRLNNSGVRILNRIKKELADARREGYEKGYQDGIEGKESAYKYAKATLKEEGV